VAQLTNGPSAGLPYDGVEDTYIGLINNSGGAIGGVSLTGPGIFGFDGDGIGAGPYCTGNGCGTVQYGTPNAQDPSGYGGPMGHFSILDSNTGTFLLNTPLADGGFTWFSLEESPNVAGGLTIGTVIPGATPLPGALPLFATGGAFLGYLARRKRKAAAKG
jgi:hypothetical protein